MSDPSISLLSRTNLLSCHVIKAAVGVELRRGRFYLDGKKLLVRVVSGEMKPLPVFAALIYHPERPGDTSYANLDMNSLDSLNPDNICFVRKRGKDEKDTMFTRRWTDLVEDVTCGLCDGRGEYPRKMDADEYRRVPCYMCCSRGFSLKA